jgi:hypothetical protein
MAKKAVPEYLRGYEFGYQSCDEAMDKYGRGLAEHGLQQLEASSRKRDAGPFDKGYAKGYKARLNDRAAVSMAIAHRGWKPKS